MCGHNCSKEADESLNKNIMNIIRSARIAYRIATAMDATRDSMASQNDTKVPHSR